MSGQLLVPSGAASSAEPRLESRYELFGPQTLEGATVIVGRRSRHFPDGEADRVTLDDPVVAPEHFLAELHHKGLWIAALENRESGIDLGDGYGTWIQGPHGRWDRVKAEKLLRPGLRIALGPVHRNGSRFPNDASSAVVLTLRPDGRGLSLETTARR